MAYGSSQALDWMWVAAVTYAAAMATWDPWSTVQGRGLNPQLHSNLSCRNHILNPLHPQRELTLNHKFSLKKYLKPLQWVKWVCYLY